ncbi:glycosyltransferase family 2 protein [Candidatus Fermentibacterales bacterium]|nr:glycosyltransferase family 2 protein [Candidatus Fermentibacterales bacterium]
MRTGEVDLLVVTHRSAGFAERTARNVEELSGLLREVIVVDSASDDGTAEAFRSVLPEATVIALGSNPGFGGANNVGLSRSSAPLVMLLNPDASIDGASLESLIAGVRSREDCAGAQPWIHLEGWPCVTASAGVGMTRYGEGYDRRFGHYEPDAPRPGSVEVPCITCAAALFRRQALLDVSGFDETIFMYFEDLDLSLRLRSAGWRLMLDRSARAGHLIGASSDRARSRAWQLESAALLCRRYLSRGSSGRLPARFVRRELRAVASGMLRGTGWAWRLAALRRALSARVRPVALADSLMADLDPDPMDLPIALERGGFALDDDGLISAGPGWVRSVEGPCFSSYGCLSIGGTGGAPLFELASSRGLITGGIRRAHGGSPLCRFAAGEDPVRIRPGPVRGDEKLAIWMDEPSSGRRILCRNARMSGEGEA